jgi:tetratricopeptide (TPR) repeat protein
VEELDTAARHEKALQYQAESRALEAVETLRTLLADAPDAVRARVDLGRALLLSGRVGQAIAELEAATREAGAPWEAWLDLGAALAAAGKLEEERATYAAAPEGGWELAFNRALAAAEDGDEGALEAAVEAMVGDDTARTSRDFCAATLESMRGRHRAAAEGFARVAEREPSWWEAAHEAGRAWLEAGEPAQARSWLERALTGGCRAWQTLLALGNAAALEGERDLALTSWEEAARSSPRGEVGAAYNLGRAALEWGNPERALVTLAAAAMEADEDDELHLLHARAAFAAGRYEEAAEQYRAVLERDPSRFRARYNLAYSLERLGRDAEALDAYHEALGRRPGHYKTMSKMARLMLRQADPAGALQMADRSLRHEAESNSEGYLARGLALIALGKVGDAAAALEEATRRDRKSLVGWRELAAAWRRLGRPGAAKNAAKTAYQLDPDDPDTLVELALAYIDEDGEASASKAKVAAGRALERRPNWSRARAALLHARALGDPPEEVLAELEAATRGQAAYRLLAALGEALRRAGRHEDAIRSFKRCLEQNRTFASAHGGIASCYEAMGKPDKAARYRANVDELRKKGIEESG